MTKADIHTTQLFQSYSALRRTMMDRPDCYKCKHRASVPGDAHSRCMHPETQKQIDILSDVLAIFASSGRIEPQINLAAARALKIKANLIGIRRGWFNWPWNFDPVWLIACDGWEEKDDAHGGSGGGGDEDRTTRAGSRSRTSND